MLAGRLGPGVLRLYRHVLQRGGRWAPTPLPHHAVDPGPHSITTSHSWSSFIKLNLSNRDISTSEGPLKYPQKALNWQQMGFLDESSRNQISQFSISMETLPEVFEVAGGGKHRMAERTF